VLPTLREPGTYTIETQLQLLTERVQQLEILNVKLQEKVAVMTKPNMSFSYINIEPYPTIRKQC
jgi:hypothetical protein